MENLERTLLDGRDSLMHVRHIRLDGTNFEIGRTLAERAIDRYGYTPDRLAAEPVYAGARRRYFQRHYPVHWERMRGVAVA